MKGYGFLNGQPALADLRGGQLVLFAVQPVYTVRDLVSFARDGVNDVPNGQMELPY